MRNAKFLGYICILTLVAAIPALAKDKKDKKHDEKHGKAEVEIKAPAKVEVKTGSLSKEAALKVTISSSERDTIRHYCMPEANNKGKKAKSLPPGLQKKAARGDLPPGWQKKLM